MKNKKKYNNFLIIILFFANIFLWFYYFVNYTDIFNEKKSLIINNSEKKQNNLDITFYSNEKNRAILIKTPENRIIIIDLIDKDSINKVINYFKKNDILIIDMFLYSNLKTNFIPIFKKILNNIVVIKVLNVFSLNNIPKIDFFLDFTKNHPEMIYERIQQTREVFIEPYLKFKIFYPFDKNQNKSIGNPVILLIYKNTRILFSCENTYKDQYFLMQNHDFVEEINNNKINIFEYPNVSFEMTIFPEFFEKINPKYIIVNKKSLFNNDFLDLNICNKVPDSNIKKIVNNFLSFKSDGDYIYF
jgi:hypothetical protein